MNASTEVTVSPMEEKSPGEVSEMFYAPPSAPEPQDSMLAMIERVAMNPDADVKKMEALLAMRREEEDRQAEQAFYSAMAAAQSEMGVVLRDRENTQTSSKYATLEAISKAIKPVWTKHGFALSFGTTPDAPDGFVRVACRVSHSFGHHRDYSADVPIDDRGLKGNANKTGTHAFGSTISYGRRYLQMMIFDIATADDDGNAAAAGPSISQEQFDKLRIRMDEVGADEDKFCAFAKIKALHNLPASQFDAAMAKLDAKAKQNANGVEA